MTASEPNAAIEAVYRIEFPKLVAGLTRRVGDLGLAEELAQDALVDALRQWPDTGTPRNPGAWLMAGGMPHRWDRAEAAANASRARCALARKAAAGGVGGGRGGVRAAQPVCPTPSFSTLATSFAFCAIVTLIC